jgi:hypothetical protein
VRKGLEAYFTVLIEVLWSKERILEVYLNVIELGPNVYGVEAAAKKYKKPPVWLVKRVSLSDSRLHRKKNKKSRIRYGYTKYRFGELRFRFCAEPSDAISA